MVQCNIHKKAQTNKYTESTSYNGIQAMTYKRQEAYRARTSKLLATTWRKLLPEVPICCNAALLSSPFRTRVNKERQRKQRDFKTVH